MRSTVLLLAICIAAALGLLLRSAWLKAPIVGPGAPISASPTNGYAISLRNVALPLGLSRGACIYYPPSQSQRKLTVFVDPGHGGPDPGAAGSMSSGSTIYEKALTLAVAQDLAAVLMHDGYGVVLARTSDTSVARLSSGDTDGHGLLTDAGVRRDILARVLCANASNATVLVSIHFNAFADASVGGAETFYDEARPFASDNRRLAQRIEQGLVDSLHQASWPVPDRGILADSETGAPTLTSEGATYGHLLELGPARTGWIDQPSQMPGVLVEPLFITRPSEADVARSAAGQQTMARGLAQGLEAFLSTG